MQVARHIWSKCKKAKKYMSMDFKPYRAWRRKEWWDTHGVIAKVVLSAHCCPVSVAQQCIRQSDLVKAKCKLCTQAFVGMQSFHLSFLSQQKTLANSWYVAFSYQFLTFMIAVLSGIKNVSWFSQWKKGIKHSIIQNPYSQIKLNTWYWITGLRAHMF